MISPSMVPTLTVSFTLTKNLQPFGMKRGIFLIYDTHSYYQLSTRRTNELDYETKINTTSCFSHSIHYETKMNTTSCFSHSMHYETKMNRASCFPQRATSMGRQNLIIHQGLVATTNVIRQNLSFRWSSSQAKRNL